MRRLTLPLAAMVAALALAACGNTTPTASTTPAAGNATSAATTTGATDTTGTTTMAETPSVAGTAATSGTAMMAESPTTSGMMATSSTAATSGTAMMAETPTTGSAAGNATSGPTIDTIATVLAAAASNPTSAGTPTALATVEATTATTATTTASTATALPTVVVSGTTTTGAAGGDIAAALQSNGNLTVLATAIQAAGIQSQLDNLPAFTLFAPTDAAFSALPAGLLDKLLADPTLLAKILSYHVAESKLMAADVTKATTVKTLEGQTIKVTVSGSTVTLNGDTKVTATDIAAGKGVIHTIDKVLLPPDVTLPK